MKQTLKTLSLYNQGVNGKVMTILETLPGDNFTRDMNTYYKSISKTFVHMTMADLNWFMRFKTIFPDSTVLENPFLQKTAADIQEKIEKNNREIFPIRKTADQLYVDFINERQEEDFQKIINYKNRAGDDLSHKLSHILLHLFNHQTHHRGAISAMLDIQGIDNDYSGLFKYLLYGGIND